MSGYLRRYARAAAKSVRVDEPIFDHRTYEALAAGRAALYFPAHSADETTVRSGSPPNA